MSQPKRKRMIRRTCLGCRNVRDKRDMIRLVRTAEGTVVVDDTGKMPGRGAYVCPDPTCISALRNGKAVAHALRIDLRKDNWAAVLQALQERVGSKAG